MKKRRGKCAYCGTERGSIERGHIIPKNLYLDSRQSSRMQRPTLRECSTCNRGWSDDEAHFRSLLLLARESNEPVRELWETKTARSFQQIDGQRRLKDLRAMMVPVIVNGQSRHMIYPSRDERVIRIIKKIVRGLSHHLKVEEKVTEERIFADVLKIDVPGEIRKTMTYYHCEPDIFQCWYEIFNDDEISTVWLLSFFEQREFLVRVSAPSVVLEAPDWG